MPQKLRKTRKMRGSRTHGYGQIGQHRKTGGKGGRNAGRHKGGWTHIIKHEPDYYGKKGFTSPEGLCSKHSIINVGQLEELADRIATKERPEKTKKKTVLDLNKLGYNKLLGMGKITRPLLVKIVAHSENAAKKLEKAGGQILNAY
ncbi:MAG: 50S ribosomal protein L15 [Candidatus Bathyarchaeota archaeon]|nr:MAG: 50S ribosomal protein L15 [Candidatus Bathyarchaeota archaeon]